MKFTAVVLAMGAAALGITQLLGGGIPMYVILYLSLLFLAATALMEGPPS